MICLSVSIKIAHTHMITALLVWARPKSADYFQTRHTDCEDGMYCVAFAHTDEGGLSAFSDLIAHAHAQTLTHVDALHGQVDGAYHDSNSENRVHACAYGFSASLSFAARCERQERESVCVKTCVYVGGCMNLDRTCAREIIFLLTAPPQWCVSFSIASAHIFQAFFRIESRIPHLLARSFCYIAAI